MSEKEYVAIDIDEVIKQTDKAIAVKANGQGTMVWIPKSVIGDEDSYDWDSGETGFTVDVEKWFAEKEGLA